MANIKTNLREILIKIGKQKIKKLKNQLKKLNNYLIPPQSIFKLTIDIH